jgi:hypothetical protein
MAVDEAVDAAHESHRPLHRRGIPGHVLLEEAEEENAVPW